MWAVTEPVLLCSKQCWWKSVILVLLKRGQNQKKNTLRGVRLCRSVGTLIDTTNKNEKIDVTDVDMQWIPVCVWFMKFTLAWINQIWVRYGQMNPIWVTFDMQPLIRLQEDDTTSLRVHDKVSPPDFILEPCGPSTFEMFENVSSPLVIGLNT